MEKLFNFIFTFWFVSPQQRSTLTIPKGKLPGRGNRKRRGWAGGVWEASFCASLLVRRFPAHDGGLSRIPPLPSPKLRAQKPPGFPIHHFNPRKPQATCHRSWSRPRLQPGQPPRSPGISWQSTNPSSLALPPARRPSAGLAIPRLGTA